MSADQSDVPPAAALRRFEQWADQIPAEALLPDVTDDLHRVGVAALAVEAAQAELLVAIDAARARGRSWNRIAIPLGVSRQAARQRFGQRP